ncbi:MAG: DUF512 domain-containing protein [Firmicutes bacterium]|nr:DUF512 domain-containing protein [Bacillota bacterium]
MEKLPEARVKEVCRGSIAEEAGIETGDIIYKINGQPIHDILEYKFLAGSEEVELQVIKSDHSIEIVSVYNEEYEDLGVVFENPLIDKARFCTNQCMFCFIDQLPENLRKTLYFKDDDSRLSFLQGNYVTLTNMTDEDIERIIRFRLSPINISVHTANPALRVKMLNNENASKIMHIMKKLARSEITMNCQIVLCREVNDKQELDRTLDELTSLYPHVNSISVVPVGLTRYREKLLPLKAYDKDSALEVIHQVAGWQSKLYDRYESRIVFLADEFYLLAGRPIPCYQHYEDFPQIENGVGLIASMQEEFNRGLEKVYKRKEPVERNISIATGISANSFIRSLCDKLIDKVRGLNIHVYAITNELFGEKITVAGLVTGGDLIKQLKEKELGSELLIPAAMLRSDRDIFLDDVTVEEIEEALKVRVILVENDGQDFIDKVLGRQAAIEH